MNKPDFQLPVPSNPPDAGSIVGILFGKDWIPVILSALELLRFEELWLSPPSDIIPQIDELMNRVSAYVIIEPQVYPEECIHFHKFSKVDVGSALVLGSSALYDFSSAWFQSAHQVLDKFEFDVFLSAGSYDFNFHGTTSSLSAVMWISCNGGAYVQMDLYSATAAVNAKLTVTLPNVGDGKNTISIQALSRNALSTDYYIVATAFSLKKQ